MASNPREHGGLVSSSTLDTPAAADAGPAKMLSSSSVHRVSHPTLGASPLLGSPFMEEFQGNRLRLPSSGYSW